MWEIKQPVTIRDDGKQALVTIPREVVRLLDLSGKKTEVQLVAVSGKIELRVIA